MSSLAEFAILNGADNRPPMLDKLMYDSWKSRMKLYMENRENGYLILESIRNGPLVWPIIEENGEIRRKRVLELSAPEKLQYEADVKATNIILQGVPADVYALRELHQLQQMQDNAKESFMVSFQLLHSHLKALSNNDFKGSCIEGGFERAFASLFDQDVQTFTSSMLLNLDQLEKQLDKEEFQETGSMDAFRVLKKQFQRFINFRYYFDDDDGLMIRKFFLAYTRTEVRQFRDTLIQHMKSVKNSINERAQHKREYDNRYKHRSGNDTHAEDADIKPVNDKEPMVEVQLTAQHNVLANEQQHSVQSEPIYDTHMLEKVDSNTT
ncbi:hypothetical protein Tco_0672731 [Tanacetum coccineum]